jgi:hypothetical protein
LKRSIVAPTTQCESSNEIWSFITVTALFSRSACPADNVPGLIATDSGVEFDFQHFSGPVEITAGQVHQHDL